MSLAKRSLIGLIVLAYFVYVLSVFFSCSIPQLIDDPPVAEVAIPTVGLVVVAIAIDWFIK